MGVAVADSAGPVACRGRGTRYRVSAGQSVCRSRVAGVADFTGQGAIALSGIVQIGGVVALEDAPTGLDVAGGHGVSIGGDVLG